MTRSLAALATLLVAIATACSTAGGGGTAGVSSPLPVASGSGAAGTCPTAQPDPLPAGESRLVVIETAEGTIAITIVADLSPIAAGNFVVLASCRFYDGVVFHRVLPGFVVQGGDGEFGRADAYDPDRVGTGGPGYEIIDEPVTKTYERGTVAMARSSQPNSVGSQFFIVLSDDARASLAAPEYNNYQIIGSVTSGMDAVDAIATAADAQIPTKPVVMTSLTVSTP